MAVFATIGASALYLLFIWLLSASAAGWIAERKGYGERVGLFFGLILSAVGLVVVLLLPARPGSTWKIEGALPNPGARRPLGLAAIGPSASDPDADDVLGPSLGDIPAQTPEPPAGGGPPEPRAGGGPPETQS